MHQKIDFTQLDWEELHEGFRQKVVKQGNQVLRKVIITDQFIEKDWCTKAHVGYIVAGEMELDFDGTIRSYQMGDGFIIEAGTAHRHKVKIPIGKQVELLLVE